MTGDFTDKASWLDAEWSTLMVAAQAGDRIAYKRLLRGCMPLIGCVARRQGVHVDRIDDIIQDVLRAVHYARHTYQPSRSFAAWLCAIARRHANQDLKSGARKTSRNISTSVADEESSYWERNCCYTETTEPQNRQFEIKSPTLMHREAFETLARRHILLENESCIKRMARVSARFYFTSR